MAKKKGKYVDVVDTLPRLANLDPTQVEKIENVKHQILNKELHPEGPLTLEDDIAALTGLFNRIAKDLIAAAHGKQWATALAAGYAKVRAVQDVLKEMDSQLTILEEAYQTAGIAQFEVEGAKSVIIAEGTVKHSIEPYAQVKDREAFRLWCIANGYERSLALAWQTTNSMVKERLTAGLAVPEGVEAFQKHKFVLTTNKELAPGEEFRDYVHPSEREGGVL